MVVSGVRCFPRQFRDGSAWRGNLLPARSGRNIGEMTFVLFGMDFQKTGDPDGVQSGDGASTPRVAPNPWAALAAAVVCLIGVACAGGRASRAGASAQDAAGPPPPPVAFGGYLRLNEAKSGYRRPLTDEGCLKRALQERPEVAGLENSVKFAVMRDGSLRSFVCLHPVSPPVAEAIERAFRACTWTPAFDPAGRPLAVWVIQPIKVAPHAP